MADAAMHVEIVSAESHVISADITEIYARSVEGEFGILPGHQPGVFALDIAPVTLRYRDGSTQRVAVHRGTLVVDQANRVIVLADVAELESEIDVERARKRKAQLERQLADDPGNAVLKASMLKQEIRLQVSVDATTG